MRLGTLSAALVAAAIPAALLIAPAAAQTAVQPARAAIGAGDLSVSAGPVILQPPGTILGLLYRRLTAHATVVDATGSGAGWRLSVSATTAGAPRPAGRPIVTLLGVDVQVVAGIPAAPAGAVRYPLLLSRGTPAIAYGAAPASGMGTHALVLHGAMLTADVQRLGVPTLTYSIVATP